ncbi:protein of unknown function [Methylocaldum szegediense]|uniref:Uncharacterized protein n=1 Tax=Methylocaldum szegediense TaxID=73780 RepID=A0ABN8X2G3_9GAMM|nr:protein of unknown function [Methylocaldum szegediense]
MIELAKGLKRDLIKKGLRQLVSLNIRKGNRLKRDLIKKGLRQTRDARQDGEIAV